MADKVKLSKDGSSIDFVQSDNIPTTAKKFRQSPEIEGFYRFIFENDLQKEAFEILDRIINMRKAKKAAEKANLKQKEREAKQAEQAIKQAAAESARAASKASKGKGKLGEISPKDQGRDASIPKGAKGKDLLTGAKQKLHAGETLGSKGKHTDSKKAGPMTATAKSGKTGVTAKPTASTKTGKPTSAAKPTALAKSGKTVSSGKSTASAKSRKAAFPAKSSGSTKSGKTNSPGKAAASGKASKKTSGRR